MILVTTAALASALYELFRYYADGGFLNFLLWLDLIIVILAIFVLLEAASAFMREWRGAASARAGASA